VSSVTAYHGTHHEHLPLVSGLCLALADDGFSAASKYARLADGEWVHEATVDLTDLVVLEVEVDVAELLRTGDDYPCDSQSERDALVREGVDAIAYDDEVQGVAHRTLRLLSGRALAAVTHIAAYDPI